MRKDRVYIYKYRDSLKWVKLEVNVMITDLPTAETYI